MGGTGADPSVGDVASVPDPQRLRDAVQRAQALGFAAATDVAASLLPYLYDGDGSQPATPSGQLTRELLARGDQLADTLAGIVRGLVGPVAELLEAWVAGRGSPTTAHQQDAACVASPGQVATVTCQLLAPTDLVKGSLWSTALHHPSGASIDRAQLRFLPDGFEELASGTALPVRVVIAVPNDAPLGRYVGVVFCTALAHEVATVHLDVAGDVPKP